MAISKKITGEIVDGKWIQFETPVVRTTHVGRVISVYNDTFQAMSDIYTTATFAEVMTDELKIVRVLVNANFECDQGEGRATVDATPGVLAIKRSLELIAEGEKRIWQAKVDAQKTEDEKNRPVVGKKMIVTRGRKVAQGTIGIVAYVKENSVLLKDEETWRDRKSQGQWVPAAYLKAV